MPRTMSRTIFELEKRFSAIQRLFYSGLILGFRFSVHLGGSGFWMLTCLVFVFVFAFRIIIFFLAVCSAIYERYERYELPSGGNLAAWSMNCKSPFTTLLLGGGFFFFFFLFFVLPD
jgi:hypothetical protein